MKVSLYLIPYLGSSDVTSFLMTEARQHNTEIRMSVSKVADKVDQLSSKVSIISLSKHEQIHLNLNKY